MSIFRLTLPLFLAFGFLSCTLEETSQPKTVDALRGELLDAKSNYVFVIAHRGDWRNAPENSIQAIENAIEMGVDIVELDVRKTKDNQLVIMHDETIDRTTNGHGRVDEWTSDSLKTLFLRDGIGMLTYNKIPTLEEALLVLKGKVLVNLDKSYSYFDEVFTILEKTGTTDHVIMKSWLPFEQVMRENQSLLEKVLFMPIIDLDKQYSQERIDEYLEFGQAFAIEFVFAHDTSAVLHHFEQIKDRGSRVWVNSLWASLNAGYEDEKAVHNPDSIYGWYLARGVNMIQTDRPRLLLEYLEKKGFRRM